MWELYRPPQFHSQNREYFGVFGPVDFGQTVDGTVVSELEKSGFRDIECDSFGTASSGVRDQGSERRSSTDCFNCAPEGDYSRQSA